jgi:hypothetical protein
MEGYKKYQCGLATLYYLGHEVTVEALDYAKLISTHVRTVAQIAYKPKKQHYRIEIQRY